MDPLLKMHLEGISSGMEATLTAALGEQPTIEGTALNGEPYQGPELPDEFKAWANAVLGRVRMLREMIQ